MGPSKFTDMQKNRKILELDVTEPPCDNAGETMADIDIEELIGIYLQAVSSHRSVFFDFYKTILVNPFIDFWNLRSIH